MNFISNAQRRAVFAHLGCARSHTNKCDDFANISNLNRFSFKDDEKKRLIGVLPSAITEVITPEDILFYNTRGRVSSRLSEKVADELTSKHGFDEDALYTTSYPGSSNRTLKLQIEGVLDKESFMAEMESRGIYKTSELDDMVKDAIKKLVDEDRFYGNSINQVVGDVCIELDKIWDSKYGERPCGTDIKKIVSRYYDGGVDNFSKLSQEEFDKLRHQALKNGPNSEAMNKYQDYLQCIYDTAIESEKNLTADEIIEKQKNFVSTIESPSPFTGLDNIASIIAGTKPAGHINDKKSIFDPRFNELLDKAKKQGLEIVEVPASERIVGEKTPSYVVGKEPNVSVILDHLGKVESSINSGIPVAFTADIDRKLGESFGYAPEAIEDYISKTELHRSGVM